MDKWQYGEYIKPGMQWRVGTRTYTLLNVWLHYKYHSATSPMKINGVWETWVEFEIKWKTRKQYIRGPWAEVCFLSGLNDVISQMTHGKEENGG